MSTYNVEFNLVTREFDSQYPITLHEKGVTQQEYQAVLNHCTNLWRTMVPAPINHAVRALIIFAVTILLGGAAAGISVALALTNNGAGIHFMYIPFAFLFVFIFILVRHT
jgi:hypothetical protein